MQRLVPLSLYAKRNGMSESNARRLAAMGQLPARKLGNYWYVIERLPRQAGQLLVISKLQEVNIIPQLAALLGKAGPTLAIDADPRGLLSRQLGCSGKGLAEMLADAAVSPQATAQGFDILPASSELLPLEAELFCSPLRAHRLSQTLSELRNSYRLLLVEAPPLGSPLHQLLLTSADAVVAVLNQPDNELSCGFIKAWENLKRNFALPPLYWLAPEGFAPQLGQRLNSLRQLAELCKGWGGPHCV